MIFMKLYMLQDNCNLGLEINIGGHWSLFHGIKRVDVLRAFEKTVFSRTYALIHILLLQKTTQTHDERYFRTFLFFLLLY